MDWYRWWHGSVTDPKLHMIAHECECTRAEIIGVWAILLEYASANDQRGSIAQSSLEAISYLSDLAGFDKICNAMKRIGLLHDENGDLFVSNWEKRQPNRERFDNSIERVRAYRQREKEKVTKGNVNVTPCNATREDKIREEYKVKSKIKSIAPEKFDPVSFLKTHGVSETVAKDWLVIRKMKKAPPTETSLSIIVREAEKAGISMQDAITRCCQNSWAGFKASWPDDKTKGTTHMNVGDRRAETIAGLTGRNIKPKEQDHERDITGDCERIS